MMRLTRIIILLSMIFTVAMNDKSILEGQAITSYELVYISNVAEVQNFDVYRSDIGGQSSVRLTHIIDALFYRYANYTTCSSNGNYIYLTADGVYRIDSDGENLTKLLGRGLFDQLNLSNSNNEIVFSGSALNGFQDEHDKDIYLYDLTTQGLQLLTNNTRQDVYPSLSPDGSKIAFSFITNENPPVLGIAIMNRDGSGETILLQDGFDNFDPVWSPDGSKIMFASNRSSLYNLYTINPDGSNLSQITANAGSNYYGRWSPDGQLISFSSNRDGNLDIYVMNADGTNLRQVTNNDATNYNQCWLPVSQTTITSLSLIDPVTNSPATGFETLADNVSIPAIPLKFRANTNPATVGSVRFELDSQSPQTVNSAPYELSWTPTVGSHSLTVTPYSGAGANGTAGTPYTINFTVAPPNNRILFVYNSHIYSMNADGTNPVDLGAGEGPAFSPDGQKIAYYAPMGGSREIFVMNADGTNVLRLTTNAADDRKPAWSPDGSRIVYGSVTTGMDWELYIMNSDGTGRVQVTNNSIDDTNPSWSSTDLIAFTAQPAAYEQIYTIQPNGSQRNRLTNTSQNTISPEWSPDGSMIVYASQGTSNDDIYRINADGTGGLRLTSNASSDDGPDWSPDGRQIIFSSDRAGGTNRELYLMNADGSGEARFTFTAGLGETAPVWGYP